MSTKVLFVPVNFPTEGAMVKYHKRESTPRLFKKMSPITQDEWTLYRLVRCLQLCLVIRGTLETAINCFGQTPRSHVKWLLTSCRCGISLVSGPLTNSFSGSTLVSGSCDIWETKRALRGVSSSLERGMITALVFSSQPRSSAGC